jgi:hypothetical protein
MLGQAVDTHNWDKEKSSGQSLLGFSIYEHINRTTAHQQIKLRFFQSNSLKLGTLPSSESAVTTVKSLLLQSVKLGRRLSLLFMSRKSTFKMCKYSLRCRPRKINTKNSM